MTRRERAIAYIQDCRDIHADWIRRQGEGSLHRIELMVGGGKTHHAKWVKRYELVLSELLMLRGKSVKQVAIDVLQAAGEPLHTKEVAKRVIESGACSGLKGKTPEATVAAILSIGSKPGGPFKRVEKATYTLADDKPRAEPTRRSAPRSGGRSPSRG